MTQKSFSSGNTGNCRSREQRVQSAGSTKHMWMIKKHVRFIELLFGNYRYVYAHLDKIYVKVRDAAYEIIKRKKATYYGVGMALVKITTAIFNNENRILPISVLNNGVYDCEDEVYIGLPSVVNRDGVHHVVKLTLNLEENNKLKKSANILKQNLTDIGY